MKKEELIKTIQEDPEMELVKDHGDEVEAFDYAFCKTIMFRTTPHTAESLRGKIHFGKSFVSKNAEAWGDSIVNVLMHLDDTIFFTLRNILIIGSDDDISFLINECGLDEDYLPDALYDENENLSMECIGISWFYESSILINVAAIKATVHKQISAGEIKDWEFNDEVECGFWETILHELRHQQIDGCPYEVPWIVETEASEKAVEEWCRNTYDSLKREGII